MNREAKFFHRSAASLRAVSAVRFVVVCCVAASLAPTEARSQNSFVNLGFEAANLPTLQPGQSAIVSAANAFPGWSVYLGSDQQATVLYNAFTFGDASTSIIGPNFSPFGNIVPAIEGRFDAVLMAGRYQNEYLSASITQVGLVPAASKSLRFASSVVPGTRLSFSASLNGTLIDMQPVEMGSRFEVYAGDIAAFAGQTAQLTISSLTQPDFPFYNFEFDAIEFSSQPVPEPSTIALLILGLGSIPLARRWLNQIHKRTRNVRR